MSNEQNLGISISEQANFLKTVLSDWVSLNQGVAVIAAEVDEKLMLGFQNLIGPKILITYLGEDAGGSEDVKELLDMSIRHWDVLIQRGKMLTFPRNTALTKDVGPVRNFYDLVEECRDTIRTLELPTPMCLNPVVYNSVRPAAEVGWMMDSYIINFDIWTRIGRVQIEAPQLSTGPYLQIQDPEGIQFNKSF
jgi:hypothetical protein